MRRTGRMLAVGLASLLGALAAGAQEHVQIRLVDGRTRAGMIREITPEGILFAPDDGTPGFRLTWNELAAEDAERLRPAPAPAGVSSGTDWVNLRFIDGDQRRGILAGSDERGLLFRTGPDAPVVRFTWAEIDPEYARALRDRISAPSPVPSGATPASEAAPYTLDGEIVTLQDGKVLRGKSLPEVSTKEYLFLKSSGGRDPVRIERSAIARIEPARLRLTDVYTVEEAYRRLVEREFPATGEDHVRLGDMLVRAGLGDLALIHYRIGRALNRPETPAGQVYAELGRLRERVEDPGLREKIFEVQRQAFDEDYTGAAARLEALAAEPETPAGNPVREDLRTVGRLLSGLAARTVEQRILDDWEATADALLLQRASDRLLARPAAVSWVLAEMSGEIATRVAQRHRVDLETARKVWEMRPRLGAEKASYEDATWLAETPESSEMDEWWGQASERSRYRYLRGRYVEKHLDVLKIVHKACDVCGGEGEAKGVEPSRGRVCPACRGLKHVRVVLYR